MGFESVRLKALSTARSSEVELRESSGLRAPTPLASHPLIDHLVKARPRSADSLRPRQPAPTTQFEPPKEESGETIPSIPGAWPIAPKPNLDSVPKSFPFAKLPDDLALLIIEAADAASIGPLSQTTPHLREILYEPAAIELMIERAKSLRKEKPAKSLWQDFRDTFNSSIVLAADRLVHDKDDRMTAFVALMGCPPNDDGNKGSGILGIDAKSTLRATALGELDRSAGAFGYYELRFLPEVARHRSGMHPPLNFEETLRTLVASVRTGKDMLALLGKAPDAKGLGGSGILGLPHDSQHTAFNDLVSRVTIYSQPSMHKPSMHMALPALASTAVRIGDASSFIKLSESAGGVRGWANPETAQNFHSASVAWKLPERRDLLLRMKFDQLLPRFPDSQRPARMEEHMAALEESDNFTKRPLESWERHALENALEAVDLGPRKAELCRRVAALSAPSEKLK